jgi:hypothetical protein
MDDSPLGRLPCKLRDKIYEFAVVHEQGIKIKHSTRMNGNTAAQVKRKRRNKHTTFALAMTCKQLHKETIDLYYGLNTFYFPFDWAGVELIKLFLCSLKDEHYRSIRHVVFRASSKQIFWDQRCTDRLMDHWYEVMQQVIVNAAKLLPGPIYVRGHFAFDCDPDRLPPRGHFDLVVDMNRIQHSLAQNWQNAYALDRYFSHGTGGTALAKLFDQMAALMGKFGPDQEESGEQSHEHDGDTSGKSQFEEYYIIQRIMIVRLDIPEA